jgi:serine/threonine protein kinase
LNTATGNRAGALVDGRYRLRRRIADGGMASFYVALDERLDRTVAVKIIAEPRPGAPFSVAAFAQEAKTIARLSHPNVVAVYDQGAHAGLPYVVMEYVPGTTLRELLNRRRRLRIDEAVDVCAQILEGLQAAHDIGLVHRDIKPENILLEADHAVVADFGIARVALRTVRASGSGSIQPHGSDSPQFRHPPSTIPSARASSSVISCNRSTRTSVISRVIRLAHRGMWMDGQNERRLVATHPTASSSSSGSTRGV